jgi:hypothetical protein
LILALLLLQNTVWLGSAMLLPLVPMLLLMLLAVLLGLVLVLVAGF